MRSNLPKVLMLGWEFPPIINGGLGVACHDLSTAMSEMAEITMVVPKTSPEFKIKNMNLVGINTIDSAILEQHIGNGPDKLPFTLHSVPFDIDPYYSDLQEGQQPAYRYKPVSAEEKLRAFSIDHLYGGDVINKVIQFAEITEALSATLDFDVIHAHDWMTMLAGVRIKQRTGKPLVMHIHSLEIDRSGENSKGWVYELEKKGMEYADMLIPVSNFTASNIKNHYGISPDKISVVHNGSTSVEAFKGKRIFAEKTVLFIGRLTRQKGPEKFLEIAERVLQKNPNVRFIMAGTGDYFKKLLEESAFKGIGNRFHLTGFLGPEKLKHLLSISDVYCMPSVSEPFGLSAVEAAQFGIPCVISRQSGVSEVLSGSLKFDHWDIDRAASCILQLIQDPVLSEKVTADASGNLNKITWSISAEKVMQAYSDHQFI
jgi:glycogen(starch) synthase